MPRALLVIDVQNEYFTGLMPVTHPAGHLENILSVMDAATAAKVPVVMIRHAIPDANAPVFRRGTDGWELHPEVAKRKYDHLIDKELPGSFTGTDLGEFLQSRGIDTVTICGYMTQQCCDTTARQAKHLGYTVEFLSDATGTLTLSNAGGSATAEELHRATLVAQAVFMAEVIDSATWIARL